MRGTNTWTKVLGAVAAASVAFAAHANPGDGIRLGGSDARLHPFFDFETRYDSNVTYSGTDAVGDLILHFKPGLELKAPGDAASIEFNGNLDWAQYLGLHNDKSANPPVDTKSLSRLYAFAGLAAMFNRSGQVSPRVDNEFRREVSTASVASTAAPVVSNSNVLRLSVPWRPGGGALIFSATGEWTVQTYEKYLDTTVLDVSNLGYNEYRAGAEVQWRFLPRTSGVLHFDYFQRNPKTTGAADDANGMNLLTGLTGLLTERVAATAKVGWGQVRAEAFGTPSAAPPPPEKECGNSRSMRSIAICTRATSPIWQTLAGGMGPQSLGRCL